MLLPQRLAGTCRRYSKNAMPQLGRMTSSSGLLLNFKWPYHANVMKTFEQVSSTTGSQRDDVKSMSKNEYTSLRSQTRTWACFEVAERQPKIARSFNCGLTCNNI